MTEAPERIWAAQNKYSGATMWWPDNMATGTEYIRADHVNELIAAAYEDARNELNRIAETAERESNVVLINALAALIGSRTPDEAHEALAARDKRVREEALQEAAEQVNRNLGKPAHHAHAAVLALIEKDKSDG